MYRWGMDSPATDRAGPLSPRTEKMEAVIQSARSVVAQNRDASMSSMPADEGRQVRAEMERIRSTKHVLASSAELHELQDELAKIRRSTTGTPMHREKSRSAVAAATPRPATSMRRNISPAAADPLAESLLPAHSAPAPPPAPPSALKHQFASPQLPLAASQTFSPPMTRSPDRERATMSPERIRATADAAPDTRAWDGRATTRPPNFGTVGTRYPTLSPRTPHVSARMAPVPPPAASISSTAHYIGGAARSPRVGSTPIAHRLPAGPVDPAAAPRTHADPLATALTAPREASSSPPPAHRRDESTKHVTVVDDAKVAQAAVDESFATARECEIAALKQQMELQNERYAQELRAWENKTAALQKQLQRAVQSEARMTPKHTELDLGKRVQEEALRAETAENELMRTSQGLIDANELIKSLQEKLEAKEVENAGLVARTRRDLRGELEKAHIDVVDRQQQAFDVSLQSLDEAAQREVARLSDQLEALRSEYVALEHERDTTLRTESMQAEEIKRLQVALDVVQKDAEQVEYYRGQTDRDRASISDLKLMNTRLQSREGALEARIVELELAAGLAQEEAAGEERMRASAELGALQERHRTQGKRDAEELGRLRGLLGAAEARLELLEETNASLEAKLEGTSRELMEVRGEKTTVLTQIDVREQELERSENKTQQLEKNLAESRALLGRQAGQLQASSERATSLEARLQAVELRLEESERELAGVAAEKIEASVTVETQAVDLLRSRAAYETLEREHEVAQKRLQDVEIERTQLLGNLDAHRQQLKTSEDRSVGLEAALASQAATLRIQLQADVEAAYAVRITRERNEWEAGSLELRQHLEAACRRRRLQAGKSSGALEVVRQWTFMHRYFTCLRVNAAVRKASRYHQESNRATDEAEAARRRELSLQEEIDMLRCETHRSATELRRHESVLPARLALIFRWNLDLLVANYFRTWMAWLAARKVIARTREVQARAMDGFVRASDLTAASVAFAALKQHMQQKRLAAAQNEVTVTNERRCEVLARLSATLLAKCTHAHLTAAWSRWSAYLIECGMRRTRVLEADISCTRESLRFQEECEQRRRDRARPQLVTVLEQALWRGLLKRTYATWMRWLLLRKVRSGKAATAERDGQISELKKSLDALLTDHCDLTRKYDEASRYEEHNAALVDGIARGREELESVTRTLSNKIVDLEAAAESSALKLRAKEVEMAQWKSNENTKRANERAALEATNNELEANLAEVKALMIASEEQNATLDELVKKYKDEGDAVRVELEAVRQQEVDLKEKLEQLEGAYEGKLKEIPQRQEALERELAATKGNTKELEMQLQGRCVDQIRLANALERAERERNKAEEDLRMADMALAETKDKANRTIDELNDMTIELQKDLHDAQEERANYKKEVASLEVELAELKGRVQQVDWVRDKMGPLSEYSKIPEHILNGYTEEITNLRDTLNAKESQIADERIDLRMHQMRLERELENKTQELEEMNKRLSAKYDEVNDLNESNNDLRQRVLTLEGDGDTRHVSPPSVAGSPVPSRAVLSSNRGTYSTPGRAYGTPSPHPSPQPPSPHVLMEPSQSPAPPASPPSPFGTRHGRPKPTPLTMEELRNLRWIFQYGDKDGDGLLCFEEMLRLSRETGGELETREQFEDLARDIGAGSEGLTFEDLKKLMSMCPRDIEDNMRALKEIARREVMEDPDLPFGSMISSVNITHSPVLDGVPAEGAMYDASEVLLPERLDSRDETQPMRANISNASASPKKGFEVDLVFDTKILDATVTTDPLKDSLSTPLTPHRTRDREPSPTSPRGLDSPKHGGRPVHTIGSFRHALNIPHYGNRPGALPFLIAARGAREEPIVQVRTYPREHPQQIPKDQQIPKNALIVEVENLDTKKAHKIATREDFLFATSPDSGCFEGVKMRFWYVEGAESIAQWKEKYRLEYGMGAGPKDKKKKRVFPNFAKSILKSCDIVMGPLTNELHRRQLRTLLEDFNIRDVNIDKMSTLIINPDSLKNEVSEAVMQGDAPQHQGGKGMLLDILHALEKMVGMKAPDEAALKDVEITQLEGFSDLWPMAREKYLDNFAAFTESGGLDLGKRDSFSVSSLRRKGSADTALLSAVMSGSSRARRPSRMGSKPPTAPSRNSSEPPASR